MLNEMAHTLGKLARPRHQLDVMLEAAAPFREHSDQAPRILVRSREHVSKQCNSMPDTILKLADRCHTFTGLDLPFTGRTHTNHCTFKYQSHPGQWVVAIQHHLAFSDIRNRKDQFIAVFSLL